MRVVKAARAALNPGHWPALARLVVPTIEHGAAFVGIEPATVLDVGANKGQFAAFAASRWPGARIVSFEPLEEPARIYRGHMGDRATLLQCALGEKAAQLEIHLASRTDSSSLLPLGERQKTYFGMSEVGIRSVPVHRLDEVLGGEELPAPILLKVDVQGFEYQVIRGLGHLSRKIGWIFIEVSFVELYEGQKMFPDIEAELIGMGYRLVGFFNEEHRGGQRIQADALFVGSH